MLRNIFQYILWLLQLGIAEFPNSSKPRKSCSLFPRQSKTSPTLTLIIRNARCSVNSAAPGITPLWSVTPASRTMSLSKTLAPIHYTISQSSQVSTVPSRQEFQGYTMCCTEVPLAPFWSSQTWHHRESAPAKQSWVIADYSPRVHDIFEP